MSFQGIQDVQVNYLFMRLVYQWRVESEAEQGGRIDPRNGDILDTVEFMDTVMKETMTPLPREFNVPWQDEHIHRTEVGRPLHGDLRDVYSELMFCSGQWRRFCYQSFPESCDI